LSSSKIRSLIGFATKARKLVTGNGGVLNSIRQNTAFLVILAEDATENSRKTILDKCSYYKKDIIIYGTKEFLGEITGQSQAAVISITDNQFAQAIKSLYKEIYGGGSNGETKNKCNS